MEVPGMHVSMLKTSLDHLIEEDRLKLQVSILE